jgi:hypothetical protein
MIVNKLYRRLTNRVCTSYAKKPWSQHLTAPKNKQGTQLAKAIYGGIRSLSPRPSIISAQRQARANSNQPRLGPVKLLSPEYLIEKRSPIVHAHVLVDEHMPLG